MKGKSPNEGKKPKIFLRTLLYATGKSGYLIEGLFLKVHYKDATQTHTAGGSSAAIGRRDDGCERCQRGTDKV
jgi:hypothetical protein